jgi:hypothetical protein
MASGLCKFSTASNTWIDAQPSIEIVANGASAAGTQHSVTFAGDAAAAGGAVQLTTPDGKTMVSSVYGLAFFDNMTGSNVLLGSIQSSPGFVVGDNEVVFSNCFSGSVAADLIYVNKLAGLEQDVVLRTALPVPESFPGLNTPSTMLEIWTEFLSAPEPQPTEAITDGAADDLLLDFGSMKMVEGSAFSINQGQSGPVPVGGSHVLKNWVHQSGRTFLVEQIPYASVSSQVKNLPPHASVEKPGSRLKHTASLLPISPRKPASTAPSGPMKVAKADQGKPGYEIDYSLVTGASNVVFQGDTTYYVSGQLWMYGSNIFEGGTVVKFTNSGTYTLCLADPAGGYGFNGTSYRPTVFTSCSDNTAGATINGSTGMPSGGCADYLWWDSTNTSVTISHARFSYANSALMDQATGNSVTLRHCQFVNCVYALFFSDGFSSPSTNTAYLQNDLFSAVNWVLLGDVFSVFGENVTADSCLGFAEPYGAGYPESGYTGAITNSIFTAVASDTNFFFDHSHVASSGSGIYQTLGAAGYYLSSGSPYQGAGTTNIDAQTLADLATMTTYYPFAVGQIISNTDVTYRPVVPRNTGVPDLGYHYDPIDVAITADVINSAITVLPGTVLATIGGPGIYGICLNTGSTMSCQGTPTSPNYIVYYNTVQEQSNTNWPYLPTGSTGAPAVCIYNAENPDPSSLYCRFTIWSQLAGGTHFYASSPSLSGSLGMRDCQFFGGIFTNNVPTACITNCLFQRVAVSIGDQAAGTAATDVFNNNLMVGGTFALQELNSGDGPWNFQNNLFDHSIIPSPARTTDLCKNNAYVTTNSGALTSPTNTGDQVLGASPAYQTGALGQNYYPTNLSLIHAGSMTAPSAGLYHYTDTTNNLSESTNIVSIGFHYVALGTNNLPLDYNGDGIPNYLQDANGNGAVDSGEIDWQVTGDLGLTVIITQPVNNSQIP